MISHRVFPCIQNGISKPLTVAIIACPSTFFPSATYTARPELFFSFPLIIAVPHSRPIRIIPSRLLPLPLRPPPPSTNSPAPHVLPPAIGTLHCLFSPLPPGASPRGRPPKTERGRMTWFSLASQFIPCLTYLTSDCFNSFFISNSILRQIHAPRARKDWSKVIRKSN